MVLALACATGCGGGSSGSGGGVTPPTPGGGTFHLYPAPETNGNLVLAHDNNFYYPSWNPKFGNHSAIIQFSPQQTAHPYIIPRNPILHNVAVIPTDVALGLDGNIWFGTYNCMIGSVTPSGTFKEYVLRSTGLCVTTVGSSTKSTGLWFTEALGGASNFIGYLKPNGTFVTYPITDKTSVAPGQIVLGPDGNMWFTDGTQIGKSTLQGKVTYYDTNPAMAATCIIAGPDQNLWFCGNSSVAQIGVMTPAGQMVAEYAPGAQTFFLTVGSDGNVWGSNSPTGGLVRITTSGALKVFNVPKDKNATPRGVAVGPDSNIWFNTFGTGDTVGMGTFVLSP